MVNNNYNSKLYINKRIFKKKTIQIKRQSSIYQDNKIINNVKNNKSVNKFT